MKVDLPFRRAFRHAAAARARSESIFLKCVTDTGAFGFGESLPRSYVTGESRDGAFSLLQNSILPRLVEMEFGSMEEVRAFLTACDGKAPSQWVAPQLPQTAAWCAVDLALLDAFGRAFRQPVQLEEKNSQCDARYSGVVSADVGWKFLKSLLKLKLYGIRDVKLKAGGRDVITSARKARRVMGKKCALRVDANRAWDISESLENIAALERLGIRCVEQPLDANDLDGLAMLARETQSEIIADESFCDHESLMKLSRRRACSGVNVRISKCGGLMAAAQRCAEAARAGLTVQVGCHVGESSLLSAAQLILIASHPAKYLEGCYGGHLLRDDPARPCLQLGHGGRAPRMPEGFGLGVRVDEKRLRRYASQCVRIEGKGGAYGVDGKIDFIVHGSDDRW